MSTDLFQDKGNRHNCLEINRSKVDLGGLRTHLNDLKEKGWVIRSICLLLKRIPAWYEWITAGLVKVVRQLLVKGDC